MKMTVKLNIYECPNKLKSEIGKFISNYNRNRNRNRNRYHESLGNVTPDDEFYGRRKDIIKVLREKKRLTLEMRKKYNNSSSMVMLC
jgi:putative transposase